MRFGPSPTVASRADRESLRGIASMWPRHCSRSICQPDLAGRAADLGAGFGYLSAELLTRCPGIAALDAYEAENRALELARVNLKSFEARTPIDYRWHDVAAGLPDTL